MKRLTITKVLVVTALIAAYVATFRVAIIVELVAWAFSLAAASFFPALVMGIWWRRTTRTGACAGMLVGLLLTAFYMIGSRFYGLSWFGTQTIASAIFGLPAGFHHLDCIAAHAGATCTYPGVGTQCALSQVWAGH